ncbi:putative interleukin-17 receptor D [Sesbania bispinosa]|nr:putative interleukin-17 receptor D [Sesbania bispinosa]
MHRVVEEAVHKINTHNKINRSKAILKQCTKGRKHKRKAQRWSREIKRKRGDETYRGRMLM